MEELQKAFNTLQTTSQRREEKEKQLRTTLEKELESYKSSEGVRQTQKDETKSMTALRHILNDKETKILQLETDIVKVSNHINVVFLFL